MVDPDPPRAPRSVAVALVIGAILIKISVILTGHFWTICDSGAVLTPEKRSGGGICYLLVHILSEVGHIPRLERVSLIEVDQGRTVHILHYLFSIMVDLYSISRNIFAFWGELPTKSLPPVVDIPHDYFAALRSICSVLQVYCVTRLGKIFPSN